MQGAQVNTSHPGPKFHMMPSWAGAGSTTWTSPPTDPCTSTNRTTLGRPVPTAIFLALNGIVLFVTEKLRRGGTGRRRAEGAVTPDEQHLSPDELSDLRITRMTIRQAVTIGAAQILALIP
ncbi:hypothetical protein GCM10010339_81350 [Streptomyces alanosinicus]|uniref:Uncharacterized protein n=1 Tax=Streptomyces alanosinicus TaxID=68171 RepID=A0A918YR91_9ACTN|nr:hypothetical protein GCM10010339_81350 [Streptomyces alanosinicus]